MPAITDTLRKLNPWHKGKYFVLFLAVIHTTSSHPTTCLLVVR